MFFRSSRVYLAQVFPGCQSSGVADAEGRGAPKNPGQDATTSSRSIASARPRSGSLDSLRIQKCALENLSRPRQGYTFLLPCKSFALVTREIRAASLSPASNQFFAY